MATPLATTLRGVSSAPGSVPFPPRCRHLSGAATRPGGPAVDAGAGGDLRVRARELRRADDDRCPRREREERQLIDEQTAEAGGEDGEAWLIACSIV